MSKVAKYGLIILTPPLNTDLWVEYQKIIGPSNKFSHPLHTACPFNQGKRQKPSGKNPPLNMDSINKIWKSCHHSCFIAWSEIPNSDLRLLNVFSQKIWWRYLLLVLKMNIRVGEWSHHAQAVWCSAYGSQCIWFSASKLDHCIFKWYFDYHSR